VKRGSFIVIEGTDGSGKSEQFKRLAWRLRQAGFRVTTFDFPRYGEPSSHFVREYLTGRYGSWKDVGPERASAFYALDRLGAQEEIRAALRAGKTVVSNRYVASNMGHQGAKLQNAKKRRAFLRWVRGFEYGMLGIVRPDLNIILHVPARIAQKLVGKKGERKYLKGKKRDIHEADIKHLAQAEKTYLEIAKLFPRDFKLVECVGNGKLLSKEAVEEKVWSVVKKFLTKKPVG